MVCVIGSGSTGSDFKTTTCDFLFDSIMRILCGVWKCLKLEDFGPKQRRGDLNFPLQYKNRRITYN